MGTALLVVRASCHDPRGDVHITSRVFGCPKGMALPWINNVNAHPPPATNSCHNDAACIYYAIIPSLAHFCCAALKTEIAVKAR